MDLKRMFDPSFLGKVSRKSDVISRLGELHEMLRDMPQLESADRPSGFTKTASQLISKRILGNSDKDMRLLASCCIVDMFRISAPDIPYSDDECVSIFEVLVNQLRGISTCDPSIGSGRKIMYILSSLATVNTCVLPVILAHSGVQGAEDTVLGLFHALISNIHQDHDEEVNNLMSNILHNCLEESDEIEQELLDILLLPLLPSSKLENIAAYNLVGRVLQSAPVNVQSSVSVFLTHVLVGAPAGSKGKVTESELTDHIYPLIYEIHKVSPNMLLKVLPNICIQLQADEQDVRLKAVKLLGRLFASQHAEYGKEFTRNFREFLGRFVDMDAEVRVEMVECCSLIMKKKDSLRNLVEEPLIKRLRDPKEEVRQLALQKLIDIGLENPLNLSVESFEEISLRVRDKKTEIKKVAMMGISKIYSKHMPIQTLSISENSDRESLTSNEENLINRLKVVPSKIVNCWSFPEMAMKHLVVSLFQEHILPKEMPEISENNDIDLHRASMLYSVFFYLNESERAILGSLLQYKNSVRRELQSFLDVRNAFGKQSVNTSDSSSAIKNSIVRLSNVFPTADKKFSHLEKLYSLKDKNIFKLLGRAVSPQDNIIVALRSREDLKGRVDSKSPLGEYISKLYDAAGYLVVNENIIKYLLEHASTTSAAAKHMKSSLNSAHLLCLLSKNVPKSFTRAADGLQNWLSMITKSSMNKNGPKSAVLPLCISTISRGAIGIAEDEKCIQLCSSLIKIAMEHQDLTICGTTAEVASILAYVSETFKKSDDRKSSSSFTPASIAIFNAMKTLAKKSRLNVSNSRCKCDLNALAAFLKFPALGDTNSKLKQAFAERIQACEDIRDSVCNFVQNHLLVTKNADKSSDEFARTMAAGLNVWTAAVCSIEEADEIKQIEKEEFSENLTANDHSNYSHIDGVSDSVKQLVETLFNCLDEYGNSLGVQNFTTTSSKAIVFETAATCSLGFIRVQSIGKKLQTDAWKKLAWVLIHEDSDLRKSLAKTLFSIIQTSSVHLKFLVYPILYATDEELNPIAEKSLLFNIKRLRRTHEVMSQKAMMEENDELHERASDNIPENILPYVLYLLSYHPDFPTSTSCDNDGDIRRLKKIATIVRMVVKVLVDSLSSEENNIAFLLKQVNMIQGHYEDKNDNENLGLYFVTRLASKVLSELVRTDDNLQEYRGDISLPMEIYKLRTDGVKPGLRGQDGDLIRNAVQEGMVEAEGAMDRALYAGKKGKMGSSLVRSGEGGKKAKKNAAPVRSVSPSPGKDHGNIGTGLKSGTVKRKHTANFVEGERRKNPRRPTSTVNYKEVEENEDEIETPEQYMA